MATIAQMTANRLNALKSTGPRTPEGKRRSARNAVQWGLFSKQVVVTEEEAREWEQLSTHLRTLLQPRDPLEEWLADEVTANWFRLARCLKIDGGLFRAYSQYEGRSCGLGTAFAQAAQLDCFGKLSRFVLSDEDAPQFEAYCQELQAEWQRALAAGQGRSDRAA